MTHVSVLLLTEKRTWRKLYNLHFHQHSECKRTISTNAVGYSQTILQTYKGTLIRRVNWNRVLLRISEHVTKDGSCCVTFNRVVYSPLKDDVMSINNLLRLWKRQTLIIQTLGHFFFSAIFSLNGRSRMHAFCVGFLPRLQYCLIHVIQLSFHWVHRKKRCLTKVAIFCSMTITGWALTSWMLSPKHC